MVVVMMEIDLYCSSLLQLDITRLESKENELCLLAELAARGS